VKLKDCRFEKNVDLAFLKDCHGFLVDRCPAIWEHMSDMNRTVGNLFLQLNSKYTRNGVSLTVGTEVLSNCLRKAFAQTATETPLDDSERNTRTGRHTTSPLATLADLAVAAAERNKGDAQVQRQLRARNDGPIVGHLPTLASNEMSFTPAATDGQDMEFAWQNYANHDPDAIQDAPAGPQASIATADQVQPNVSGSRAEISEQHLPGATPNMAASDQQLCLEPMQMLSDIGTSWPHGTIPPHPALNSVEDPIYGFHQDGMVTNQDMMMPGPDGHFWSLDWDDI
jgi:hypothetical protein